MSAGDRNRSLHALRIQRVKYCIARWGCCTNHQHGICAVCSCHITAKSADPQFFGFKPWVWQIESFGGWLRVMYGTPARGSIWRLKKNKFEEVTKIYRFCFVPTSFFVRFWRKFSSKSNFLPSILSPTEIPIFSF